ncbi:MAG TPA: PEP/pyruvate-binding domain-containing protein [Myxococcaceae bacterium]|nr:PEP/pyruvate-binding domain-containing protein [Myxococcaceae bacterium]
MSPRIVPLPSPRATASELGGKGANLQRLMELGAPVPSACVATAQAYRAHVASTRIQEALAAALATPADAREPALVALRAAIVDEPLAPALAEELDAAIQKLGPGRLAVRSSAIGEDGAAHSFAGQHDTFLGVEGGEEIGRALRRCWASAWTARAVEYRARNGMDPSGVAMAVVLQRLVSSEVSGVLFTCDPLGRRTDRVVIEAVYGLGESLVSGRISPDRLVLARPALSVVERATSEKPYALVPGEAGTREEALAPERARQAALDDAAARKLAEEGLRLEAALGGPQDIEWAIAGGQLSILQARPVTAMAPVKSDKRTVVWSNTNAGELLPDVATPMTFSVVRQFVLALLNPFFEPIGLDLKRMELLGLVAGRVYFSMNTFMGLLRMAPGMAEKNPAELFGGDHHGLAEALSSLRPEDIPALKVSWFKIITVAPTLAFKFLRHANVRGDHYVEEARAEGRKLAQVDLTKLTEAQLVDRLWELLGDGGVAGDAFFCAGMGMSCANGLAAICRRWLGDENGAIANRLLSGVGGLESAEAGLDIWRIADAARAPELAAILHAGEPFAATRRKLEGLEAGRAFLARWDAYMARHGHHARGELDVYTPRWREEPDAVLATVRAFLSGNGGTDPLALHAQRAREREQLAAECRARLNPVKRALLNGLMERAQRGLAIREALKSESVRRVGMVRELILESGRRLAAKGRLGDAGDVFFLDLDELRDELRGTRRDEALRAIPERRRQFETNRKLTPPSLVVGDFDPAVHQLGAVPTGDGTLRGLAVSAGVAVGRARVVLRADADERVRPGEILVAPFTDPGWTPYFVAAAGLVVDLGGMLSHGSVVAREYGIPAVVNVGHGTRTLKTGQLIRVDGNRGEVTVLEESAAA